MSWMENLRTGVRYSEEKHFADAEKCGRLRFIAAQDGTDGSVGNGIALSAGDALKVTAESLIALDNGRAAEVIVFDLPGAQH